MDKDNNFDIDLEDIEFNDVNEIEEVTTANNGTFICC